MNITVEQVEKVRTCTGATWEEARTALEQSGGNVLDAVILLERKGRQGTDGGSYSTRPEEPPRRGAASEWKWPTWRQVWDAVVSLCANCLSVFLEVWKAGEMTCRVPLLAAVLLVVAEPYLMVFLLLAGLCFGYRVHLIGQGTEGWGGKVNQVVDQVGDTVSDALGFIRGSKTRKKK